MFGWFVNLFTNIFGEDVYDKDGYDKDGYDKDGYDKDGFKRNRFNGNGIHKDTKTFYGPDGFDEQGFDKNNKHRTQYEQYKHLRGGEDLSTKVPEHIDHSGEATIVYSKRKDSKY